MALSMSRRERSLRWGLLLLAIFVVLLPACRTPNGLRDGNWKIDYELRDKQAQGGGPHYVISAKTGAILSKRYDQ